MGWTSFHATFYNKNNDVDRKAECDNYFNNKWYRLEKSVIKGSTYYAAVTPLFRSNFNYNEEGWEPIPESEQKTVAFIILTYVNCKEYHNFSYKIMDETAGPYYYDCPESILKLLSPTDNEFATKWRENCRIKNHTIKEKQRLAKLPYGAKIEVLMPCDAGMFHTGDKVVLTKIKQLRPGYKNVKTRWVANCVAFSASLMQEIIDNDAYIILENTD